MRDSTMDVLLRIGIPAGVKGMTYICDAVELFDTDPYYPDGKMSSLYADIAHKNDTTPSRVERAIRHAFETALTKGNPEVLEQYLDTANPQNSNLLKSLYFRMRQKAKKECQASICDPEKCEMRKQIYHEVLESIFGELEFAFMKHLELTGR